jgi:hypothetical protein
VKQLHFKKEDVISTITPTNGIRRILKDSPIPSIAAPSFIRRRKSKKSVAGQVADVPGAAEDIADCNQVLNECGVDIEGDCFN